jgi:hypothetical protein
MAPRHLELTHPTSASFSCRGTRAPRATLTQQPKRTHRSARGRTPRTHGCARHRRSWNKAVVSRPDEPLRDALAFYRSVGATRYVREGEALLAATA